MLFLTGRAGRDKLSNTAKKSETMKQENPKNPNVPALNEEPDELSYYRLTLLSFLRESHPGLATDTAFVNSRSDRAAEAFSRAVQSGLSYDDASRLADGVLFEGLHFSRLDTLVTVLWNEFADEVPEGRARELALRLLPECAVVFDGYGLSDDFMFSPDFDRLYNELTGTIVIWLEENGI